MKQGTILGSQVGRWILLAALVVALGAFLLTTQPVGAQLTPPLAPTSATFVDGTDVVAVGTQTVELNWTAPAGTILGYKIDRSTDTGTTWVVANANTRNDNAYYSDTHSSLAGKSVRYRVAAINSAGMGPYLVQTSGDETLPKVSREPGVPRALKAAVSPTTVGSVVLSWDAPLSQGESAITAYIAQWSADGEHPWAVITTSGTGTTVTDTGVSAGTTRYYRVAATNTQGDGPYSASVSATARPVGVPEKPTGLTDATGVVAVGTQTVELNWTAPAGTILGYKIDRSTDAGATWVVANADTGNDNAYYSDTHSSLAGKSVRYRVAAINSVGMGPYLVQILADVALPKAGTQPGAPTGLTVTGTNAGTVTLSWNAPSGGASATGYVAQWSADGEHPWAAVSGTVSGTTVTDDIPAGATRYYRVAATNADGTGPYSAVSRGVTAGVPEAPTGLTDGAVVAVGTQTVELNWMAPAGTIVGYKIDRSTDAGTTWVVANANTGNKNVYYSDTHSSLAGKSVRYRVAAINSIGVGPYLVQTATDVALPKAGTEPGAPTGLTVTVSPAPNTTTPTNTDVNLSWSAPSQGQSLISAYIVQWSADGEHPWATSDITLGTPGNSTTATATIPAGATRYYRVAATNTQGNGPYSAVVSVTARPVGVPAVPTDDGTTAFSDGSAVVAVGTQTVEFFWVAPAGTILGYKIDRSTDAGATWVVASDNTGNKKAYYSDTHSSLAGKSVRYRVAAINSVGMGPYLIQTAGDEALPKAGTQPDAPTGLTIVPQNFTSVVLFWDAPSQGGSAITGYVAQWSADGEHPWTVVSTPAVAAATTASDAVTAGTTRYYRVAATNGDGTGPYSDVVRLGGPADQMGTVTLSTQTPLVGAAVTATLEDPDGMTSSEVWKWQKSMDMTDWMDAAGMGAATDMYTPETADVGYYLRAMVTYNDEHRPAREATSDPTTSMVAANNQPTFADGMGAREVAENTAAGMNVGAPVMATDADADDTLTYSLGGDDAMYFTIDTSTGQIMVGEGTMLDYETTMSYMVTVTVNDGSGAPNSSASIDVTISVTDVDEGAVSRYDEDDDGQISGTELSIAISHYINGDLGSVELSEVIAAYING